MTARLALLAIASATLFVGCVSPQAKEMEAKSFKQVTLPPNIAPVPTTIDETIQQQALNHISLAFGSSDPVIRAQALEAMSRTNDPAAGDRVIRAMADKEWIVRFAGAMCAGDLKLKNAYKAMLASADDADPNVRVAVRYALHQLGDKSLSKELEQLSVDTDPRVRANVATVLGLMNEPTAMRLLQPMIKDVDYEVRVQAAESMWRLGEEIGQKYLVAASVSKFVDDQMFAILGLAATHDQRVKPYVMAKFANDRDKKQLLELQLVAARALGMIGDDTGFGLAVRSATSRDARHRALAALALGDIGRPDAQDTLAKLMQDPSQEVRLSSSTALRLIGQRNGR